MLTILHVIAPARVGGAEAVVHALAAQQRQANHQVHVAAVVTDASAARHFLEPLHDAGVQGHALVLGARDYLGERRRIAQLCSQLQPCIFHTHGYRADVLDAPIARARGIPTVTTVHGFTGGGWKNRLFEWTQRRSFRRFHAVVAVSKPLRDRLAGGGIPLDRLHLVPNACRPPSAPLDRIGARMALGASGDAFLIGFVGRLSHEKGADLLLDALALLDDVPVKLSVIGDGDQRITLDKRAREHGLADRIKWHGAIPQASRFFNGFDLFVLSSRSEGTPIVLLEAMAAGVPVVATSVGGVPDIVSSEQALLVPSESPSALASAIRSIRENPRAARERASAALSLVAERYASGPWLARYDAVYAQLLVARALGTRNRPGRSAGHTA